MITKSNKQASTTGKAPPAKQVRPHCDCVQDMALLLAAEKRITRSPDKSRRVR
jgi:hypothetical protein